VVVFGEVTLVIWQQAMRALNIGGSENKHPSFKRFPQVRKKRVPRVRSESRTRRWLEE
jgi:hypothetical protein